jgi:hypothetical protein
VESGRVFIARTADAGLGRVSENDCRTASVGQAVPVGGGSSSLGNIDRRSPTPSVVTFAIIASRRAPLVGTG